MDTEPKLLQFLRLVRSVRAVDRLALIGRLRPKEISYIRQTAYNLLFNSSMVIEQTDRSYFRRNIGAIRLLASRRVDIGQKRELLTRQPLLLKRLAKVASNYLLQQP